MQNYCLGTSSFMSSAANTGFSKLRDEIFEQI